MTRKATKGSRSAQVMAPLVSNWDDVRFFLALATHGTLAKAARELKVEVSTVHRRIASLESSLGMELFQKHSKGHRLTDGAETLLPAAHQILQSMQALEKGARRATARHVLTLTTTDDLIGFLAPVVAAYSEQTEGLQIRLQATEQTVSLVRGDADIAIRFVEAIHADEVSKPLGPVAFALYASKKYAGDCGDKLTLSSLGNARIVFAEGPLESAPPFRWLLEKIAPAQIAGTGDSVATIHAMTRGGLGVAPLPCFVGDADAELERVYGPLKGQESMAYLVYASARKKDSELMALVKHLRAVFARSESLFLGR